MPVMIHVQHMLVTVGCRTTECEKRNVATSEGRRTWLAAIWKKSQIARSVVGALVPTC